LTWLFVCAIVHSVHASDYTLKIFPQLLEILITHRGKETHIGEAFDLRGV